MCGSRSDPFAGRVHEVTGSFSLERWCTLRQIDHEDTWQVQMTGWPAHRAGHCARVILDEAPGPRRRALRRGWAGIGLELQDGPATVCGWAIRREEPDVVVLGAASRVGMPAELIFRRTGEDLQFATLLELGSLTATLVWRATLPTHRIVVRRLLVDACSRLAVADHAGAAASTARCRSETS